MLYDASKTYDGSILDGSDLDINNFSIVIYDESAFSDSGLEILMKFVSYVVP